MVNSRVLKRPPPIRPHGRIAVVAPASPPGKYVAAGFDDSELCVGLDWLRARYDVQMRSDFTDRDGYLAGSDERRCNELSEAMLDPSIEGIVCARGGYGTMRIARNLPWDEFKKNPKWLAGFSDITALHLMAQMHGVESLHGANVTSLAPLTSPEQSLWSALLEDAASATPAWPLRALRAGDAAGELWGGNLTLVHMMVAARLAQLPASCILMLEDVTERPYRLDRMLTAMQLSGALNGVSAIVFGEFFQCEPGPDGTTTEQVLHRFAESVQCPVYAGAPFGHGTINQPFVLGRHAKLQGNELIR